jgi:hypothetical protein
VGITDSVTTCTYLVTQRIKRTKKFLCALSAGKDFVDSKWIDECAKQETLVPITDFLLRDDEMEKKYEFDLQQSVLKAREKSLLDGYKIYFTKNVIPRKAEFVEIVLSAGAEV